MADGRNAPGPIWQPAQRFSHQLWRLAEQPPCAFAVKGALMYDPADGAESGAADD